MGFKFSNKVVDNSNTISFDDAKISNDGAVLRQNQMIAYMSKAPKINMYAALAKEFHNYNIFFNVLIGINNQQRKVEGTENYFKNINILEITNAGTRVEGFDFLADLGNLFKQNSWLDYSRGNIDKDTHSREIIQLDEGIITQLFPNETKEVNMFFISPDNLMSFVLFKNKIEYVGYFILTDKFTDQFDDCMIDEYQPPMLNTLAKSTTYQINKELKKAKVKPVDLLRFFGFIPVVGYDTELFYETYSLQNAPKKLYIEKLDIFEDLQEKIENNPNLSIYRFEEKDEESILNRVGWRITLA